MTEPRYKIKNWEKFQHFKDRRPPWIKVYRDLLDDRNWFSLGGDAAQLLVNLWLLASEDTTQRGILPSEDDILFRLRLSKNQFKSLCIKLSHWLIQVDDNVISNPVQVGPSETETETETETYQDPPTPQPEQADFGLEAQAPPEEEELAVCIRELPGMWNSVAVTTKPLPMIPVPLPLSKVRVGRLTTLWHKSDLFKEYWRDFPAAFASKPFFTGGERGRDGKVYQCTFDAACNVERTHTGTVAFEDEWQRWSVTPKQTGGWTE